MADIGKPMKRVRVVPLTEPVPDRTEPALPAVPAPREPVPEKV